MQKRSDIKDIKALLGALLSLKGVGIHWSPEGYGGPGFYGFEQSNPEAGCIFLSRDQTAQLLELLLWIIQDAQRLKDKLLLQVQDLVTDLERGQNAEDN